MVLPYLPGGCISPKQHIIRAMSFLISCGYLRGRGHHGKGNKGKGPVARPNLLLLGEEGTSRALGGPRLLQDPGEGRAPGGRLLCRAAWAAPTPSSTSGNAACSDMASEIPNMQLHEKVTAQSEQRIKH